ncbi:MAG: hypothetical protein HY332_02170 [Chloroflexi bacterium]|nr:hypothetical protein [Chloroflexota bacterium]
MRRLVVSVLTMVMLLTAQVPAAGAMPRWCEDDPPVKITTLSGSKVVLHVTNYGLMPDDPKRARDVLKAVKSAVVWHTVAPTEDRRGTDVTVYVLIRSPVFGGPFETRSIVHQQANKPEPVLAEAYGMSGSIMEMRLRLDVP